MGLEEEKRILYVAMTRAKKSLFLSGSYHETARRGRPLFLPLLQKGKLWKALEFKSGHFDQEQFDAQHRFQVEFYLFCLQALHPEDPLEGYVMYLKEAQSKPVFLEPDFEKRLCARVELMQADLSIVFTPCNLSI